MSKRGVDEIESFTAKDIVIAARDSKRPRFLHQRTLESSGIVTLDSENTAALKNNFLSKSELKAYIDAAVNIPRFRGKSAFNSEKPRREVCYTVDGKAFRYSGHAHPTTTYPPHTKIILERMREYCQTTFPYSPYRQISTSLDILYSNEFEGGGKAGAHGDNEQPWGLVLIFSLGQTRWLRVRRKEPNGEWLNICMKHNSLVTMHGATFQHQYTHQVDRLGKGEKIYPRLSFNVRYLAGEDNLIDIFPPKSIEVIVIDEESSDQKYSDREAEQQSQKV